MLEVVDDNAFNFDNPIHPHRGEKLNPILLVIRLLYCMDVGFLPLTHLLTKDSTFQDIFSAPMIATAYYILLCYFLTNGKDIPSGSQSKSVNIMSLRCHLFVIIMSLQQSDFVIMMSLLMSFVCHYLCH